MKKALSIIFAAMLALGANAQNTHDIVVWHGTQSQTIQAVDSITFVESKVEPTYVDLGLSVKWEPAISVQKILKTLVISTNGEM